MKNSIVLASIALAAVSATAQTHNHGTHGASTVAQAPAAAATPATAAAPVSKDMVEAEVRGDLQQVIRLAASRARGKVQIMWLGEEDSNPH